MGKGLAEAVVNAQLDGASVGQAIGQALGGGSGGVADAVVNAQLGGAATGQAVGPAAALSQSWSALSSGAGSPWAWLQGNLQDPIQVGLDLLQGAPPPSPAQAATSASAAAQASTAYQAQAILTQQAQTTAAAAQAALGQSQAVINAQAQAAASTIQWATAQAQADAAAAQAAAAQAKAVVDAAQAAAQAATSASAGAQGSGAYQAQAIVNGQAQAAAAAATGSGAVNPLVGAQLGGAAAGAAIGPAVSAAGAIPSLGGIAPWLAGSGIKGVMGSIGTLLPQVAPNVGGILFDQSAEPLTSLEEIVGAQWDAESGSLVLMGRQSLVSLPAIDRDHLAVALRAALADQSIGVSIDPPAEYREGLAHGRTPPDNTPMLVSYLGNTRGTLFGAIMVEADRLLKCLDKGVDNETRDPRRAHVPGFRTLLEMIHPSSGREANIWHRFWFVIGRVQLKQDPVSKAVAFGEVKMKVLTEVEKDGASAHERNDPLDSAFADHLTRHYDDYAKEFPVLARLKELAKIAALAKYLANLGVPLDLDGLFAQPTVTVDTPDTTPGISVVGPNVEVRQEADGLHTHMVSLFGGVDLDPPDPEIVRDDGSAQRLAAHAQAARPSSGARAWRFAENGKALGAAAVPLATASRPLRHTCHDLAFPAGPGSVAPAFARRYDPGRPGGPLGQGWSIAFPYRITVLSRTGKREEVLTMREREKEDGAQAPVLMVHNGETGDSGLYRRVKGEGSSAAGIYCLVTKAEMKGKTVSFSYDPSRSVTRVGECWELSEGGRTYSFDPAGRLAAVKAKDGSALSYDYHDGRLVGIRDSRGQSLTICYYPGRPERVFEVQATDGRAVQYLYGTDGSLGVVMGSEVLGIYRYDEHRRLTEVRGWAGHVAARAGYDDLGNAACQGRDVVDDGSGSQVERRFDQQGRLISARDKLGTLVEYEYGPSSELRVARVCDAWEKRWELRYDAAGHLCGFYEAGGVALDLSRDERGAVKRVAGNGRRTWKLVRDDRARVIRANDEMGRGWEARYDDEDRLVGAVSPAGEHWRLSYGNQPSPLPDCPSTVLHRLDGPGATVGVVRRSDSLALRVSLAGGWWRETVYDGSGLLREAEAKGAARLRFSYDRDGSLRAVSGEGGGVNYQADEQDLTVKVVFA